MNWLPALIYAALVLLIAAPLVAVSRVAGVICAVFIAAVVLIDVAGLPQVRTYLVLHIVAFASCARLARTLDGRLAASLFFPMAVFDAIKMMGGMTELTWWWATFFAAMAQLGILGSMIGRRQSVAGSSWVQRMTDLWLRFALPAGQ